MFRRSGKQQNIYSPSSSKCVVWTTLQCDRYRNNHFRSPDRGDGDTPDCKLRIISECSCRFDILIDRRWLSFNETQLPWSADNGRNWFYGYASLCSDGHLG